MKNRHAETGELQDLQEGLLDSRREEEVREHLEICAACREEFEALGTLLGDLRSLPTEAEPSRDLWPQIEWRLGGAAAPAPALRPRTGITLRAWQLLAASLTVALISGGAVWAYLLGTSAGRGVGISLSPSPGLVLPVGMQGAYDEYQEAAQELQDVIEAGREILDAETIQVLEENLAVIDKAISESAAALAQDPASPVLRRILADSMRRRVQLLQKTAEAIYATI